MHYHNLSSTKKTAATAKYLPFYTASYLDSELWHMIKYANQILMKIEICFLIQLTDVYNSSCATYQYYFARNGQRISHWDDPSWPIKRVWHVRSHLTATKNGLYILVFEKSVITWFQSYLSNRIFYDTGKYLSRCWTNKLWCSTRIYVRATPLPNIYKWLTTGIKQTGHTSMLTIPLSFIKIRMLKKTEEVLNKDFSSLCERFIDKKLIHFGDD